MGQWQHEALIAMLQQKVADIEALQLRLAESRAHLLALIEDFPGAAGRHRLCSNRGGCWTE